jgi:hypothetical protein
MAMLGKSGSSPFYKTGPLYVTGDPVDPTKKKAKTEAKAKAEKSATSAKKVYGKSTTKTERITSPRGRKGTKTTVTTPYSQSGEGSVSYSEAYKKADKAKYPTLEKFKTEAEAYKSGKDVKTSVKYDKVKGVNLKPKGTKLTTVGPKAPVPKVKTPEKPYTPSTFGGSGKTTGFKVKTPKSGPKRKKAGSGHPCKSCN